MFRKPSQCLSARSQSIKNLKLQGIIPDVVQKMKYLGVQVDNSLDWKEQVKVISSEVSKALVLLKYAKKFLLESPLRSLYLSIVEPHFHYCCSVWGCSDSNTP